MNSEFTSAQVKDYYEKLTHLFYQNKLVQSDVIFLEQSIQTEQFALDRRPNLPEEARCHILNKELVAKTQGRINVCYWESCVKTNMLDVLFITHSAQARGHIYRVQHVCRELNHRGIQSAWVEAGDMGRVGFSLPKIKRLVIFRCELNDQIGEIIRRYRTSGVEIIFDIDDFIFETSAIERQEIHFINEISPSERQQWIGRIELYRACIKACDSVCVPTKSLAWHARKLVNKVKVFPNNFDSSVRIISRLALATKTPKTDGRITIGYASGTPTHEQDFAIVKDVLLELMSRYDHLNLIIVGYLRCIDDSSFAQFRDRISVRSVVPHSQLPFELNSFDINIIPLHRNRFTDAKSELKYFESALLKVPSVATANPVYSAVIQHADNGYLAKNQVDWLDSLSLLIENKQKRIDIGLNAYRTVKSRYAIETLIHCYKKEVLCI